VRFDAINPCPALTTDELDTYCGKHGLVLPASLRRQLLDQNGGAPNADTSVPLPDGDETDLFCLFGLMMRDASSELAGIVETYAGVFRRDSSRSRMTPVETYSSSPATTSFGSGTTSRTVGSRA
jgi:hypothetical protein